MNDITGHRFGRLTALEVVGTAPNHGGYLWRCKCDCGNEHIVAYAKLSHGRVRSCGCLRKEISMERQLKHASARRNKRTRLYSIWLGMRERCSYPQNVSYPAYGGRGIKVCNEWASDFDKFRNWALSNGYNDTLSIDRIDSDLDYSPENCQWIPLSENCAKQRKSRFITIDGVTKSITKWAKTIQIAPCRLSEYFKSKGVEATRLFLYETLKKKGVLPLIER